MDIQVKINDNNDTVFNSTNGRYTKTFDNPNGFISSFTYKSEKGFLNALKNSDLLFQHG